jgi:hypothetical protein
VFDAVGITATNANFQGDVKLGTLSEILTLATPLVPVDNLYQLGDNTSPSRWRNLHLSSTLCMAKGTDLASGATITVGITGGYGNYFDVTGAVTIAGISSIVTGDALGLAAGTQLVLKLDSNPAFTHDLTGHAYLQLAGSTDFRGRTGDHIAFCSETGSGSWREMFRSYRPMAYGQCTSGAGRIAWAQVNAAQNTWYRITDADMIDGVLSSVTHDGSGRLTVVTDGMYRIDYTTTFLCDTAATNIFTGILQNGTTIAPGVSLLETVTANVEYHLAGHAIYRLAVGNTIDIGIFTDSAGTPDLTVDYLDITLTQVGW